MKIHILWYYLIKTDFSSIMQHNYVVRRNSHDNI
jgi:hypothetical protein